VSTRQARGMANPGYSILTRSTDAVNVFAFVDANGSGAWDVFEASTVVGGVTVNNVSQTFVGNFSVFGGDAARAGWRAMFAEALLEWDNQKGDKA